MGGEKSTPPLDGSGPRNPMSHAPAVRHVNISGIVGCPTGTTSTPIRAPSVRAMSRRMIPTEAPFSSPVRGSFVYITECTPTRILPACTRSATRGSGTCCAFFMYASTYSDVHREPTRARMLVRDALTAISTCCPCDRIPRSAAVDALGRSPEQKYVLTPKQIFWRHWWRYRPNEFPTVKDAKPNSAHRSLQS